jgi:ribosomal protein S18 acetylase RimI-like enzyme
MAEPVLQIRKASAGDLPVLARFGLALARLHATFDEERFVVPGEGETRFRRFFEVELGREDAVVLIAELGATPVGYAFVRLEGASLEELRGPGAFLHDIYVAPEVGTRGVGRRLVESAFVAARSLGSTSLSLGVSPRNARARALFDRMGFRATMIEMRAEVAK